MYDTSETVLKPTKTASQRMASARAAVPNSASEASGASPHPAAIVSPPATRATPSAVAGTAARSRSLSCGDDANRRMPSGSPTPATSSTNILAASSAPR